MRQEKWMVRGGRAKPIVEKYGLHPVLARIIAGRLEGQDPGAFLDRSGQLFDPLLLKNVESACRLLLQEIDQNQSLCIVGDYDVDGVTSTAILYLGLKQVFPEARVSFRIPERMTEGYGISMSIAQELYEEGVTHVLTCDNGIAATEPIRFLKEKGIRVIVTDHHEVPRNSEGHQVVPEADFVINPHLEGDPSPQKEICGAFVALQMIRLLYRLSSSSEQESDVFPELFRTLYGYAALGTVCDVMPLTMENRRLVYQGLRYLNEHPPLGIKALMDEAQVSHLDPVSVGFRIGPMLNAGGRLGSQNRYVHILLSDSSKECQEIARELNQTNQLRQEMTDRGFKEGLAQVESLHPDDLVKVIYLPELHESIAGLVAGKVKERLYRPVLTLTRAEKGLKGSARSIESYMMVEELSKVRHLFSKMGGHAMAAGFSLDCEPGKEEQTVEQLREELNAKCTLSGDDLVPTVYIDAQMKITDITIPWLDRLEILAPFGVKNPSPQLAEKDITLLKCQLLGAKGNVVRLLLQDEGGAMEAVCFDRGLIEDLLMDAPAADIALEEMKRGIYFSNPLQVDIIYEPKADYYYGSPRIKIQLKHIRYSQKQ